jgi:hypothetical protein
MGIAEKGARQSSGSRVTELIWHGKEGAGVIGGEGFELFGCC